jgi:4-aminobutyrate aminotransferase-like enzyme
VPPFALPRAAAPVLQNVSNEVVDLSPASDCDIDRVTCGIGRYGEPRLVYTSGLFARSAAPTAERRTIHLGLDLFAPAGTPVFAPLDGVVHATAFNDAPLDYGPVVVLRHECFFTLYGHLSVETLSSLTAGDRIAAGQQFATLGAREVNGGWTPHLHMQVLLDDLDDACDFPGVSYPSEFAVYRELSPDPNRILQLPVASAYQTETVAELTEQRRASIGPNLSVSYAKPIAMARGWMQYLYDNDGQRYLDFYNNVPHVGHCHPDVVRAVQKQLATLNTNTRYLNESLTRYACALTAKLPEPLRVVFLTASGSEANELAIRLARTYTGRRDIAVMASGYHGHTNTMIDLSEYKFAGPGGAGKPEWVRLVPVADPYRNPSGCVFPAGAVRGAAAFLCESFPSVGGQIVFPPGYLQSAYAATRDAGAVCIADEVQTGFGRLGTHFWGFEAHGAVPDIVVMGKPIGNGYPMGAVVTTRAIADAFANGMEFFSTFGGTNAACAAGLAVLAVIEREGLQEHARAVGDHLLRGLREFTHPLIGDIRGSGLFLGIELVEDRATKRPAAREAARLVNRFRDHGILLGTDGPLHNVIKLRGPMPLTKSDADFFLEVLAKLLRENA